MIRGANIPTFLWKYAIKHAVYIQERAPTKALSGTTPYEAWFGHKPDVSHLWEFGTPVYVLLQGQQKHPKLLPRSKQQIFIGYDDGSKSIKYYNPETWKVLTSQNFHFLTHLSTESGMPDLPMIVDLPLTVPHKGEHINGLQNQTMLQPGIQCNLKRQHEDPHTKSERTENDQI